MQQVSRSFEIRDQHQLPGEQVRRPPVQRPRGQRAFERHRTLHLCLLHAPAGPEVPVSVGCERATFDLADRRSATADANGFPGVDETLLGAFAPGHRQSETGVDGRRERIVSRRLGERLAVERPGRLRVVLHVGEPNQRRGPLDAAGHLVSRSFQQRNRAVGGAGEVVQVGGEEETALSIRRIGDRCQPQRLLSQVGGPGRSAALVCRMRGVLEDRGGRTIRIDRREGKMASPLLDRWNDLGEPRVQMPPTRRRQAHGHGRSE